MNIETTRFGNIDIDERLILRFAEGLHGFPDQTDYILLRPRPEADGAWLQSTTTPWLALPVVTLAAIAVEYPSPEALRQIEATADRPQDLALLLVLNAPPWPRLATVNLLAPLVVNASTRKGTQLLLRGTSYSAREPLALREFMGTTPRAKATDAMPTACAE